MSASTRAPTPLSIESERFDRKLFWVSMRDLAAPSEAAPVDSLPRAVSTEPRAVSMAVSATTALLGSKKVAASRPPTMPPVPAVSRTCVSEDLTVIVSIVTVAPVRLYEATMFRSDADVPPFCSRFEPAKLALVTDDLIWSWMALISVAIFCWSSWLAPRAVTSLVLIRSTWSLTVLMPV